MKTRRRLKSFATAVLICATVITCAALSSWSSEPNASRPRDDKQNANTTSEKKQAPAQTPEANKSENGKGSLEEVLHRMDQTAANFDTAQADFVWKNYTSVVNTFSDPQNGKIYFRRSGKQTEMAANLLPPYPQQIIFSNGKVEVYKPTTNELQTYDASAHREEFETFLVLGFGSGGSDLHKSFEVSYAGHENVNGIETDKLELVPIAANIKARFPKIVLWIDSRGLSVRQQLFEENDDYRLADYSNIKLHGKLPKDAFKLKTSGKVKSVSH